MGAHGDDVDMTIKLLNTTIMTPDYLACFPIQLTGEFQVDKTFPWISCNILEEKLKSEQISFGVYLDSKLIASFTSNLWEFLFPNAKFNDLTTLYEYPAKKVLLNNSDSLITSVPIQLGNKRRTIAEDRKSVNLFQ